MTQYRKVLQFSMPLLLKMLYVTAFLVSYCSTRLWVWLQFTLKTQDFTLFNLFYKLLLHALFRQPIKLLLCTTFWYV